MPPPITKLQQLKYFRCPKEIPWKLSTEDKSKGRGRVAVANSPSTDTSRDRSSLLQDVTLHLPTLCCSSSGIQINVFILPFHLRRSESEIPRCPSTETHQDLVRADGMFTAGKGVGGLCFGYLLLLLGGNPGSTGVLSKISTQPSQNRSWSVPRAEQGGRGMWRRVLVPRFPTPVFGAASNAVRKGTARL